MGYGTDLANAAVRHFEAAEQLDRPFPQGRRDVAGYLYGISAECALKKIMMLVGMRPMPPDQRKSDPFYLHFPELKTALRDAMSGRMQSQLAKYANDGRLMSEWNVEMRYAHSRDVLEKDIAKWAEQAKQLKSDMGA